MEEPQYVNFTYFTASIPRHFLGAIKSISHKKMLSKKNPGDLNTRRNLQKNKFRFRSENHKF